MLKNNPSPAHCPYKVNSLTYQYQKYESDPLDWYIKFELQTLNFLINLQTVSVRAKSILERSCDVRACSTFYTIAHLHIFAGFCILLHIFLGT